MNNNNNASDELENDKPQEPPNELPSWLKDKNSEETNDSPIENEIAIKPKDLNFTDSDSTDSGWHKEVEAIVTESTKPIILDKNQFSEQEITNRLDPTEKFISDESTLPGWLDLVIETKEEKNTTQLNLNSHNTGDNVTEVPEKNPSKTISEVRSSDHDEFNSTPSMQTPGIIPQTQPLFINIVEGSPSRGDRESKDFRLELIENLLLRNETDKVSALGQELIKDQKSVEELSELLAAWLTENPDSVEIWHLMGDAYMHLNRPTKALRAYSEATQLLSRKS